jgi:hypothetical protein
MQMLNRRKPISSKACWRCEKAASVEVSHAQRGARLYCIDHFHRLGDVPPGAVVRWA